MQGTSLLLWGLLFGAIGIGFLTYGRKQRAVVPLIAGLALLFLPYFFANVYLLVLTGAALVALPYFVRL
jgi:predicted membrane protein